MLLEKLIRILKKVKDFKVNIAYSRCEKHVLTFACQEMGWQLTTKKGDGDIIWFIDGVKSDQIDMVRNLTYGHFNRYPKSYILCNKREFHILLNKYSNFFPDAFKFVPNTFVLPDDYVEFKDHFETHKDAILIAKPSKGRCGQGIFF